MCRIAASLFAASLFAASLLAVAPVAAQSLSLAFIGQQTLPFGFVALGSTVGGLSGIDYDAETDRYIAISDSPSDARFYTLNLALTSTAFTGVSFNGVTRLRAPGGTPYATGTIDPEAIRFSSPSTILYTSEGFAASGVAPFLREANLDGGYIRDFNVPTYYDPALGVGVRNNLAFESLTTVGNTVVTATENALSQDGGAATATSGSPSRILMLSDASALAEYVYEVDPIAIALVGGAFATNGLTELLSLGGTQYLAVERSFTVGAPGTGYTIKLYEIDTAAATNVLGESTLAGLAYIPVEKTLLFDLGTLGIPLDNIEGLTFGKTLEDGRRSLILVADDNFSSSQFQQFLAFAIGDAAAVPEPATWTMMIMGFGLIGARVRRRTSRSFA